MTPIFKNAGQAAHFAFTIESYPVNLSGYNLSFIGQGEGRASGIDFGQLQPVEIRAECAKIRATVGGLDNLERAAIQARFTTDPMLRAEAMRALTQHAEHIIGSTDPVVHALCWRHFQPVKRKKTEWSLRSIGIEYGLSKDKAARIAKGVDRILDTLERCALDLLNQQFKQSGVTAEETEQ